MSAPAHSRQSLYLPGVEAHPQPGVYRDLIEAARGAQRRVLEDLGSLRLPADVHGPPRALHARRAASAGERSAPGLRELIAAYTSYQNECGFCTQAHAAAASELLGDEALVWAALRDLDSAPLDEKEKLLLRFVGKVTRDLPAIVGASDVDALRVGRVGRRGDLLRDHDLRALQLLQPLDHRLRRSGDVAETAIAQQGRTLARARLQSGD